MSISSAMTRCRLLIDQPAGGAWNMAVDELLLESAASGGGCALRFYGWSIPTLSLGYFQRHEDRWSHLASRECPLVRRASGGGAILHDRELTYSFLLPATHPLTTNADALYRAIHMSWIDAVASLRIRASLCETRTTAARGDESFLCFLRRAKGDVLVGQQKIVGSAQRRRRGAVLQHGSCLLDTSPSSPETPGLTEAAGVKLSPGELIDYWLPKLRGALQLDFDHRPLSPTENARVHEIAKSTYDCPKWTEQH